MANETPGLLGRKLGMTQIYNNDGAVQPVTIVEVGGNAVLRVKTEDSADGYNAVQLGFDEKKEKQTSKPEAPVIVRPVARVVPNQLLRRPTLSHLITKHKQLYPLRPW